jgi:hypothetical protein
MNLIKEYSNAKLNPANDVPAVWRTAEDKKSSLFFGFVAAVLPEDIIVLIRLDSF